MPALWPLPAGCQSRGMRDATAFDGFPPDSLELYALLEEDNSRERWHSLKPVWERTVRDPMLDLLELLADEFDPEGTAKLFRPHRDVRFSADKTPYKTHQGAFVAAHGSAGYYVQLSADGLLAGGGFRSRGAAETASFRRPSTTPPRGGARAARGRPSSARASRSAATPSRPRRAATPPTTHGSRCCATRSCGRPAPSASPPGSPPTRSSTRSGRRGARSARSSTGAASTSTVDEPTDRVRGGVYVGVVRQRSTPEDPYVDVYVIGAGPAGLAVAATLRERGLRAAVLDRGTSVGDSWRRHYDRLHLHTPRELSGLPGAADPPRDGSLGRPGRRRDLPASGMPPTTTSTCGSAPRWPGSTPTGAVGA